MLEVLNFLGDILNNISDSKLREENGTVILELNFKETVNSVKKVYFIVHTDNPSYIKQKLVEGLKFLFEVVQ